ncbi:DUF2490 domain-containing protein [Pedobacter glucosidilyticus]|uniref:DUF2490 domain-containing protein n=1 Tax=Pedobacter glucosidilyticus TaxID=1122941 RepID=UPI0026F0C4DC|nr:DUF2490 domain-containing protein [Pedobacter glucosidilyticus]
MFSKKIILFYIFLFSNVYAEAQPLENWMSFRIAKKLTSKFAMSVEYMPRFTGFFNQEQLWLLRPDVKYNFNKSLELGIGYAYFETSQETFYSKENRFYIQANYKRNLGPFNTVNRLRIEQRYFDEHANLSSNLRVRFQINLVKKLLELNKQNDLSLIFGDEIMYNSRNNAVGSHFDQNRIHIGFQFSLRKELKISPFYQFTQQESFRGEDRFISALRVNTIYSF